MMFLAKRRLENRERSGLQLVCVLVPRLRVQSSTAGTSREDDGRCNVKA